MTDFAAARRTMVSNQLRTYDVTDQTLLAAFESVPREVFVAQGEGHKAYLDLEVNARDGKTRLMTPMVTARMIQALELNKGEKVLDVGSAGYGAAVLKACGLEAVALVADAAQARDSLAAAGAGDIPVVAGSYAAGAAAQGPYDAIVVHGAAELEPDGLLAQLKDGGALSIIMLTGKVGRVMVYRRVGKTFSKARAMDGMAPVLESFVRKPEFAF
jgi:protein-L-isoaspartate(D-aspartate) O-methyltransferase